MINIEFLQYLSKMLNSQYFCCKSCFTRSRKYGAGQPCECPTF